ncbi:MAG: DUF1858 domain-containing protein [Eubacteriaceae bacterium]|nr:DUF1858 domain-containing protein [Eubacteriaceae bacterium]
MKITADMNVYEVLDKFPDLEDVFAAHGLTCVGCPGSSMENIEEAAEGHGVDLQSLLSDLNDFLGRQ